MMLLKRFEAAVPALYFGKIGLCVIAAVLLFAVHDVPRAHAQAKNEIRITIQRTTTALPIVVAEQKGLFAKHNVAAKYTISQVPISDSIAALGRQFDIAMGTQPALIAAAGQGLPIVVVTGGALDTMKVPTSDIVASKESGITSLKQLEGKTVGTLTLTGNIHYALLDSLQKQNVDSKRIRWVTGTVPQLPDLLKANRVDAIEEIEPFATSAVSAGGVSLGNPFRSIGDRAYVGIFLAQREWADANKDRLLGFSAALEEAAMWIESNREEAKAILSSYTGLKGPVLDRVPIPEFHFSTTAEDLKKEQGHDLATWLDILKRTSDFPAVKQANLMPAWAR
jgi:NitT/TauT family transport system substrate-binding protein